MGIFGEVQRQFIARPDGEKEHIFYKWPDRNVRKFSQLTVEQDELAILFRDGKVYATFPPGRHTLDSNELPVLGSLLDMATGGNFFLTEIYFISNRQFTGLKFGGIVDDVLDPETQFAVGLRVFGEYALHVLAADKLLLQLIGSRQMTRNEDVTDWVREFVLREIRSKVTLHITDDKWSVLGLSAHTDTIENEIVPAVNEKILDYGLEIVRLGNLTVSLSEDDQKTLKNFRRDIGYTKLAGGFAQYGVGKALIGIGEGAADGGAQSATLGAGFGLGGLIAGIGVPQATQSTPAPSAPAPKAGAFCSNCGTAATSGAKFCSACGNQLI